LRDAKVITFICPTPLGLVRVNLRLNMVNGT
jgi:hypothetical protein